MSNLQETPSTAPTTRRDFIGEFVTDIGNALEEGTAPWCKPWKAGELAPPYNPVSGTIYSGMNFVRLAKEGLADPRFLTYNGAQKEGLQVKKGEKGRPVVFWSFVGKRQKLDEKTQAVLDDKGKPVLEEYKTERPFVQHTTVFHASQIEGIDPWQKESPEWAADERAESILRNSGANISHETRDTAYYAPATDSIHLRPKSAFPTAGDYYSTALHELAHWTGHKSRMDRDMQAKGTLQYAKEELRAEIAAWMMATKLGLPFDPESHRSYVEKWAAIVKDEPKFVVQACRDAEKICAYCLNFEQEKALEQKQVETQQEQPDVRVAAKAVPQKKARPFTAQDTRLQVPYVQKDAARAHGAMWDVEERTWFAPKGTDLTPLAQWLPKEQELAPEQRKDILQHLENADKQKVGKNSTDLSTQVAEITANMANKERISYEEIKPLILGFDKKINTRDFDANEKASFKAGWLNASTFNGNPAIDLVINYHTTCPWSSLPDGVISIPSSEIKTGSGKTWTASDMGAAWYKILTQNPKLQEFFCHSYNKDQDTRLELPDKSLATAYTAATHGAKWDVKEWAWYAPKGTDLTPLAQWLPKEQELAPAQEQRHERALPTLSPEEEFAQTLKSYGLDLKGELPIMDGAFHRVPVENGKAGAQDGSYMGYRDGKPAGTLTNFKTGEQVTWKYSGGHTLSATSIAELTAKSKIQAEAREQARTALQKQTAKQCQLLWEKAAHIPEGHPYLVQKGVDSEEIRKGLKIDSKGNILVPLRDTQGIIHSLQTISMDTATQKNTKRFTKNAKKSGMFHLVDPENVFDKKPIILAEGLATAASINKATGLPVACVFDAGNLIHVAKAFREKYPDTPIIIMADNDSQLATGNVGLKKAHEARQAVSDVFVCTPHFTEQEQKKGNTDFNDFQKLHGVAKLKEFISNSFCKATEVSNALRMDISNIITAVGKSIQPKQLDVSLKAQGMSR